MRIRIMASFVVATAAALCGIQIGSQMSQSLPQVVAQGNYEVSCIGVLHRMSLAEAPCTSAADDDGAYIYSPEAATSATYTVEYRYGTCSFPITWGSWQAAWDEDALYFCDYTAVNVHTYRYISRPVPPGTYCVAEWRVITNDHDGNVCCGENDTVTSTESLNQNSALSSSLCLGLPSITFVLPYH